MESKASGRFLRISLKKLKPVADLVRGQKVQDAVYLLQYRPQKAAKLLLKVLNSALAAAKEKNADEDKLYIKRLIINKGIYLKRFLPVSKGQAHPINRPTSHINIVLSDEIEKSDKKTKINLSRVRQQADERRGAMTKR